MIVDFLLRYELETLKDFLDHVCKETEEEIARIVKLDESGEYQEMDGFDNALDWPMSRQEIASRAVLYEITSLIEHELQDAARTPWLIATKKKHLLEIQGENIRDLQMVSDIGFGDVVRLIEQHYGIKVSELPNYDEVKEIREMVNAFKHRKGLVDFRKSNSEKICITERYKADIQKAYDAIEQARVFIKALWKETKQKGE